MKSTKLTALCLAALLIFSALPLTAFAGGGDCLCMFLQGDYEQIIYDPTQDVGFEVSVYSPLGTPWVYWYEVDENGNYINLDKNGDPVDIGFGGEGFMLHGIREENMSQWLYYRAYAEDETGYAYQTFRVMLAPFGIEDDMGDDHICMSHDSPVDTVIFDATQDIGLGVNIHTVSGVDPYVYWYEVDEYGQILEYDENGTPVDLGYGGLGFVLHGIREEYKDRWLHFMAYAEDETGSAFAIFNVMLSSGAEETEEDFVVDMILEEIPDKTQYEVGEYIDLAGFKIRFLTTMGFRDTTDATEFTVYPAQVTEPGEQEISIEYQGHFSCEYVITATGAPEEDRVVDMILEEIPDKTQYEVGEYIDLAGFKVRFLTTMGFRDTWDAGEFTVYPAQVTEAGEQEISIEYQGHFSCEYVITATGAPEGAPDHPFTDVPEASYYEYAVSWAYQAGVTDGNGKDKFMPEQLCTRGQVVTFLWRALGEPEPESSKNPFADVTKDDYFNKPVLWAVEQGITDGTDPTHFTPTGQCKNSHILTFIWRAAGRPGDTGAEKTASWWKDAYDWARYSELLSGTYDGEYDVNAYCPRRNVVYYLWLANL